MSVRMLFRIVFSSSQVLHLPVAPAFTLCCPYFAHDDRQNFNILFRLRQLCSNGRNFIECLNPALELTALFCALHRVIFNQGELSLAVPEISQKCSRQCTSRRLGLHILFRTIRTNLNPAPVGRSTWSKRSSRAKEDNLLVVFPSVQPSCHIRRSHAVAEISSDAKINLASRAAKALYSTTASRISGRSRYAFQTNSRGASKTRVTTHPLNFSDRVFCHL